jgi:hyperosmotically inducible periplasmic protein
MRIQKYVYHVALAAALSAGCAFAQTMPQQRDPSGAPQQPSTAQQPSTSQAPSTSKAPAATGDVQGDIQSALQKDPTLSSANVNVQVSGQNVELTGTVPSADAKDKAEQIAKAHSGGMNVKNRIKVSSSGAAPK